MAFDWEPTPAEVKALIASRNDGRPFSDTTIPTHHEVTQTIGDICVEIEAKLQRVEVPENLAGLAKRAAKLGAAAEIERAYFPEQHDFSDTATYARLFARYREVLEELRDAVLGLGAGSRSTLHSTAIAGAYTPDIIIPEELIP